MATSGSRCNRLKMNYRRPLAFNFDTIYAESSIAQPRKQFTLLIFENFRLKLVHWSATKHLIQLHNSPSVVRIGLYHDLLNKFPRPVSDLASPGIQMPKMVYVTQNLSADCERGMPSNIKQRANICSNRTLNHLQISPRIVPRSYDRNLRHLILALCVIGACRFSRNQAINISDQIG
jgi:hypothetical protein